MDTLSHADACEVRRQEKKVTRLCTWHEQHEWKREGKGVSSMQPPNEAICNLFVPLLVVVGLIGVVVLQYALGDDIDF